MGRQYLSNGGHGDGKSRLVVGYQTHADAFPNLLNETAYLYSGNKITLTPIAGGGGSFVQPTGWTATSFFPVANNEGSRLPEIDLQGKPLQTNWSSSYYPWKNGYEGFEWRDDLSWTKGVHQFKFGFSWLHDYKNQQLQSNTQGTAIFNSSAFSGDSYVNFLLGDASSFEQLNFLYGKHWVNNNYGFYFNRQLAHHSSLDTQPRPALRRLAACLRAI